MKTYTYSVFRLHFDKYTKDIRQVCHSGSQMMRSVAVTIQGVGDSGCNSAPRFCIESKCINALSFSGHPFGTSFRDILSGHPFGTSFRDILSGHPFGTSFRDILSGHPFGTSFRDIGTSFRDILSGH